MAFERDFDRVRRMGISGWDQPGQRPRGLEVLDMFCSLLCRGEGVEMRQEKLTGARP